jgi:hypothetical protein
MITARIIRVFDNDIAPNERSSYHSWEHCYRVFCGRPADLDLASLHLGFYLASWGMYRGSAAIRNFDYLIHRPVAEALLEQQYDPLRGASLDELMLHFENLLWPLVERIKGPGLYPPSVNITDTLVTKILMGTLGCTPAYDRYFKEGLEEEGLNASFSRTNFQALLQFCQHNHDGFIAAQQHIQQIVDYPIMRVVDMYFHDLGRENPWIDNED